MTWFKRVSFDSVGLLEQADPVPPAATPRGTERVDQAIIAIVGAEPGKYSPTKFRETHSGLKGRLKASKGDVAQALDKLISEGRLILREPTGEEGKRHKLGGQTRHVLVVGET